MVIVYEGIYGKVKLLPSYKKFHYIHINYNYKGLMNPKIIKLFLVRKDKHALLGRNASSQK